MNEIEVIKELLIVCDRLLGPEGCPWDREQTLSSSRQYVLEEVCELIEAIDLEDNQHIEEELGDLFFNAIFLGRLAEKEGRCRLSEAIIGITEKLIRRHPHVFGDGQASTSEEVMHHWERIKGEEKHGRNKNVLDGIPKSLPSLSRAAKMYKKMRKAGFPDLPAQKTIGDMSNEEALGKLLWQITVQALDEGLDPEHALRKELARQEQAYSKHDK